MNPPYRWMRGWIGSCGGPSRLGVSHRAFVAFVVIRPKLKGRWVLCWYTAHTRSVMLVCCLHIPYWAEKGIQTPFHSPGGASLRDLRGSDFILSSTWSRSFLLSPCGIQLCGELLHSSLSWPVILNGYEKKRVLHQRVLVNNFDWSIPAQHIQLVFFFFYLFRQLQEDRV